MNTYVHAPSQSRAEAIAEEYTGSSTLEADFVLPPDLVADRPPEARGIERDDVRLLVSGTGRKVVEHTRFQDVDRFLSAGDVLVINTSRTMPAALIGRRQQGNASADILVHFSTRLQPRRWVIELRQITSTGHAPLLTASRGERITLPGRARAVLVKPYRRYNHDADSGADKRSVRLWEAHIILPETPTGGVHGLMNRHGKPIRYQYVPDRWPLEMYQTVFARDEGSAEMPSAGRAFSASLVTRLVAKGIRFAPITLHTGVSSQEAHEPPYPERFEVSCESAEIINLARAKGHRVIGVGTTAVRAIESVAGDDGTVRAGRGWTDLVITPERGVRVFDGLLSGFHPPLASHLQLLEAIAGWPQLQRAYAEALEARYSWHEFGDLHLMFGHRDR